MKMKPLLHLVAGARPNFMKLAPIVRALARQGRLDFRIVHTGQHHDREMSDVFFEELGIPAPDVRLGAGGGTHAEQTAKVMVAYEQLCATERPAATLVVGDVNSTLACALVAKKLHIPVAHVEAGLRSFDMGMPEEVNRLATDAICDWYFVTEPSAREHLRREGKPMSRVFQVGNVMVDNLLHQARKLEPTEPTERARARYGVVTLHRPSNVDDRETLARIASALRTISAELPLVFPVHPRTRANLEKFGIELGARVTLMGPLGYMAFLRLWKDAAVVLTDSGGLQEETTALGVQCVTLRENTERPITVSEGTNVVAGTVPAAIVAAARAAIGRTAGKVRRPALWDGLAAERIAQVLARELLPEARENAIVEGVAPGVQRLEVLGLPVDNLSMDETLGVIEGFVDAGLPHQHVVVNVDKIVKARNDASLRDIISRCALINADGMPVVWASRMLGTPLKERVAGVDLFDALMGRAANKGWRVFLLGAREEIVSKVRDVYGARYPGLVFAGHRNGYWKPDEEQGVAEEIRDARADLLFVAISSPKKEQFLGRWNSFMNVPFAMGVGGSFDVFAGLVNRAPVWMQKSGLEWFYRFLQEPRRMFRRYFVDGLAFIGLLAREIAARRMRELKRAFGLIASLIAAGAACVHFAET